MKNQKSITVVLLLSLMTFIIEVERKYVPEALAMFQVESSVIEPTSLENHKVHENLFCKTESIEETNQKSI